MAKEINEVLNAKRRELAIEKINMRGHRDGIR